MLHSTKRLNGPSCGLTDVLITTEISTRPPRTPNISAEHAALQQLASGLQGEPAALLQQLTELACVLCAAETAGVSAAHGDEFRWLSVAGTHSRYVGLTMPHDQSPCGICLERGDMQLFTAPDRYFTALATVSPPIAELLIVPIRNHSETLSATLWIASHDTQRHFDAEDVRVLTALAGFAAAALRIQHSGGKTAKAENLRYFRTESSVSEPTAQETLARLEAILNTIADGIITIDDHGRIESVNRAAEQIFGYSADALLGNNISMLMPEPESNSHDHYLQRYLISGERIDSNGIRREVTGRRSDGSLFPLELALSEPRLAERRIFTGILHDISERKQAEAALRESEERFRLFIHYAPAAVAMFDREMRYLAVSRRFLDDYHIQEADILGRSHYEIFPEIPERWREFHQRGLQGEVLRAEEDCFERADGSAQWVRWEIHPWYTGNTIGGIVILAEEISARKHAEHEITRHLQELQAANDELARFNRAAVDRELRIIELKKQVNDLCAQNSLPQRYRVDFDEHTPQGDS